MENKKFFGYKAAIGAFLVIFCNLGAASTLGVFLPSMSEYTGWSVAVLGYNGTFNTIGNVLLSLICVKALSKLGPKKLMFISIIGIFLNFQFYTFATDGQNVTSLVFIYLAGLMASFAIVFGTHAVCTYVISQWFVGEKRGKVISTVLSGASFGAAAWVFVAGQMFRVMNYKMCYQILSWVLLVVGLLSVIFLIRDPEKMGQKPMGTEVTDEVDPTLLPGVTRAEAIKSPSFWFFAIALLLGGCEGSAWLVYSPTWWTMNGLTPTEASNWNAIYTVLAGFVMLGVGSAFSKVGPTVFSVIVCIAFSLCMVFLIIFGISFVLRAFQSVRLVQYAFNGIRAGVLALILKALWSMYRQCPKSAVSYVVMAAAFLLTAFLSINVLFVILGCAAFGLLTAAVTAKRNRR